MVQMVHLAFCCQSVWRSRSKWCKISSKDTSCCWHRTTSCRYRKKNNCGEPVLRTSSSTWKQMVAACRVVMPSSTTRYRFDGSYDDADDDDDRWYHELQLWQIIYMMMPTLPVQKMWFKPIQDLKLLPTPSELTLRKISDKHIFSCLQNQRNIQPWGGECQLDVGLQYK